MQRYLTSYSKNYIKVRDRKLNLETEIYTTERELADTVQDAIKSTNYHLTSRKNGKIQVRSINDLPLKLSKHKPNWGDILPENITWESDIIKQKEKEANKQLNKILFGENKG